MAEQGINGERVDCMICTSKLLIILSMSILLQVASSGFRGSAIQSYSTEMPKSRRSNNWRVRLTLVLRQFEMHLQSFGLKNVFRAW